MKKKINYEAKKLFIIKNKWKTCPKQKMNVKTAKTES